ASWGSRETGSVGRTMVRVPPFFWASAGEADPRPTDLAHGTARAESSALRAGIIEESPFAARLRSRSLAGTGQLTDELRCLVQGMEDPVALPHQRRRREPARVGGGVERGEAARGLQSRQGRDAGGDVDPGVEGEHRAVDLVDGVLARVPPPGESRSPEETLRRSAELRVLLRELGHGHEGAGDTDAPERLVTRPREVSGPAALSR